MNAPPLFGPMLKAYRKAGDLTQEQLAEKVNYSVETIKKIEANKLRPGKQLTELLAVHLVVPVEEREMFVHAARTDRSESQQPHTPVVQLVEPVPLSHNLAPSTSVSLKVLPHGTVTFLFTDIEGSTQLWEQDSQGMNDALTRHDALLRAIVEAHCGIVFKMVGDGVRAAFARASDALAAALAAQRAVAEEPWAGPDPLRVRMALHTGCADERDRDYFGPPLNRLARLLAAGHGGQTLLSLTSAELVRDHLPQDAQLRDLGTHRLKDLSRPEHIFELVVPDLPSSFPQLNTLDARHTNLPVQPTPLIGREQEVDTVCELLRRADVRLVTLTGPGGTGKTRLGVQVAAELLDDFDHGVYFVNLAPISEPTVVCSAIAEMLGLSEKAGQPLLESLKYHLREKQMLLVLDNFEQVLDAASLIAELLWAAPSLKVLVTSRVPLHLSGEHEFTIPPLALPDLKRLLSIEELSQSAAVKLFIERAQAVKTDFTITTANARAIAEICHRLDGLPLAIELAAKRIKLFSPKVLLARLEQRLMLLTGGARNLPAHQQTMRATIDWSYQLLDATEQILFRRLAVFARGCTIAVAQAVCNLTDEPQLDVLNGLAALVDKSLVRQTETWDAEPRFMMLETIREYALEQLAAHGEATLIEHLHANFFMGLAEKAEPKLTGGEQRAWLELLEAEHENLRAALGWTLARREAEMALRLSGALWRFWWLRGYSAEGCAWLNSALALTMASPPVPLSSARATALYRAGLLALYQGDYKQAAELCEESLAVFQALGDTQGIAWARYTLGSVALFGGDLAQAAPLLEASLALFREFNDARGIGWSLTDLGTLAQFQGDYMLAAARFKASLALFREMSDMRDVAGCLNNLGSIAQSLGNYAEAEGWHTQALEVVQLAGDKWGTAACLLNLGWVVQAQGEYARAKGFLEEGIKLLRAMQVIPLVAFGLVIIATVAVAEQQHEHATRLLGAAHQLDDITVRMDPADRTNYDRTVAVIRAHLDESVFAAAWAEGQAMTLEQAIAYADLFVSGQSC